MKPSPKAGTYSIPPLSELLKIQTIAAEQTPFGWRSILCRAAGEMLLFVLKLPSDEQRQIVRSAHAYHTTQKAAMDYATRLAEKYNRFVKGTDFAK